jgi:anti-sigma factor RsiW
MNCQEAIERLPWWLNGSLEPAERREVEDHLAGCASCQVALGETRLAWEVYAEHIPAETLVAYADDEQPWGSDRIDPALLERHLAGCPQCAAELEMARASRLLSEHEEVSLLVPRPAVPARPPRRERAWQAAALAASLTGLVAIGGWVGSVQQLQRAERAPAGRILRGTQGHQGHGAGARSGVAFNAPIAEISATVLRDSKGPAQPTLRAGSGHARLILYPRPSESYREHAAEVRDASGKVIAATGNLELKPGSYFSVDVDTDRLAPGAYTIQVFGTDRGARQPLDRFPFSVK